MSRYQYQPLDSSTNQIRLLRLRKGYHTDTIECEIFETSLDEADCIPYEALSYTWGFEAEPAEVKLNGELAWVTWNLYMALSCLRLSDRDRLLWVDALCINQSNDQERGHQVSHMKEIYQNAEQVLIWLGRAGDNVDLLFDLMTQLERRAMLQSNYRKQSPDSWRAIWPAMVEEQGGTQSAVYVKRRAAMLGLLQREWFRRIWVLQETASARRAFIVCGWRSISSRTFALMPSLMDIEPDAHSRAVLEIMPGHLRGSCWWSERRTLETLLWKFKSSRASDPRDRVYALLGISSDAYRKEAFPANYEVDICRTTQNTISYLLFGTLHDPSLHQLPGWDLDHVFSLLETPDVLAMEVFKWALLTSDDTLALRILNLEGLNVNQDGSPGRTPLLILISQGGHEKVLQHLLAREDLDVNVKVSGFTALYQAVINGFTDVVKALLTREDIHIQTIGPNGFSPLTAAADKGNFETVKLLLDHGADIDGNYRGSSINPLRVASTRSHPEVTKLLLERGARADGPNGLSLLTAAAGEGNLEMAKALLDGGANVEGGPSESRTTPLWVASKDHHPEVVRLLLERGAEVNTKHGQFGSSPLWAASELGYVEIMALLLDAGADIESHQLPHRATPLACAVENGHWDAVDLLLDRGANPFALHTDGEMVIHKAVRFGKIEFLRILHHRNVPMDTAGRTPLHVAAKHGQVEELKFLLGIGADVSRKNDFNQTPLMEAVAFSDASIVEILIEHGSDVNTLEDGDRTPLMVASSLCRLDTVRVLLDHGADPNIQDVSGRTALMRVIPVMGTAKKNGLGKDAEIATLLLESGADVNCPDHQGRTALSWAAERGLFSVIRVLLGHGADKTAKDMFGRGPLSYSLGK